jgi:phosphoribosylanthranilate isomerase
MVRVKICGITNWPDARLAVDEGADALGFNFFPPSPRSVSPAAAWDIIRRLPPFVAAIGVFVDWKPAAVTSLARALHLSGVQLHGNEPAADVEAAALSAFVIKAVQVKQGLRPESLRKFRAANAVLLDGFRSGLHGGTGATADWNFARRARRYANIILAGGLTPENIAEAIAAAEPCAVDVASGVEKKPGKKDPAKLRAFLRVVISTAGENR